MNRIQAGMGWRKEENDWTGEEEKRKRKRKENEDEDERGGCSKQGADAVGKEEEVRDGAEQMSEGVEKGQRAVVQQAGVCGLARVEFVFCVF